MNALTLPAPVRSAASPPKSDDFPSVADLFAATSITGIAPSDTADEHELAASTPEQPFPAEPATLLILGRDEQERPHASRFEGCDASAVAAAAKLMGMVVLPVSGEPLAALAAKLPAGRLFGSGKAFVPFVSGPVFKQLVCYTSIADRAALDVGAQRRAAQAAGKGNNKVDPGEANQPAPETPSAPAVPPPPAALEDPAGAAPSGELIPGRPIKPGTFPKDWDAIRPLSIVLATMESYDSWWPAEVTENKGDGLFALKWVDGDGSEPFLRRAEQMALLHPSYRGM